MCYSFYLGLLTKATKQFVILAHCFFSDQGGFRLYREFQTNTFVFIQQNQMGQKQWSHYIYNFDD